MLAADITGGNAERLGAIDAFTNTEAEFAMVVGATNLTRIPVFDSAIGFYVGGYWKDGRGHDPIPA
ncbi:hypothetical protein ACFIQG_15100 [Comamonas odontotermitis]|uniref:hypothetical protein n=1 Tax=Comamonas odontotermitis TaxID=379895 RepID=UPI00366D8373